MAPTFRIVPVLCDDEGPCRPVADDKMAEMFGVYEDGGLIDLYDTREEAEQAVRDFT